MKRVELGIISVILAGLILSLELYGLKFIYLTELKSGFPWKETPLSYLQEPNILLAIFITFIVIVFGVIVIVKNK